MKTLRFLTAMIGVLGLIASSAPAQTPVPPKTNAMLSASAVLTNIQTLTVNGPAIAQFRDRGFAVSISCVATDATSANLTFTFQQSVDGAAWQSAGSPQYVLALNGTTGVVGVTNFNKNTLDNVRYVRLHTIANAHTNSVTVSNVTSSIFP